VGASKGEPELADGHGLKHARKPFRKHRTSGLGENGIISKITQRKGSTRPKRLLTNYKEKTSKSSGSLKGRTVFNFSWVTTVKGTDRARHFNANPKWIYHGEWAK
jgi:hypothetical protein